VIIGSVSERDREKWDQKYTERGRATRETSAFLQSLDAVLPRSGRALDVGGGSGRHAIWLAGRGLDVTIADVSEVGLKLARDDAAAAGVALR
jgi:methylase of polypeptide subunit release factors